MNSELDILYRQLLHVGFLVLRQAVDSADIEWISSEIEFLHNVPSLIGEKNVHRHVYFWNQERKMYLDRVEGRLNEEIASRMRTYYLPVLDQIGLVMNAQGLIC